MSSYPSAVLIDIDRLQRTFVTNETEQNKTKIILLSCEFIETLSITPYAVSTKILERGWTLIKVIISSIVKHDSEYAFTVVWNRNYKSIFKGLNLTISSVCRIMKLPPTRRFSDIKKIFTNFPVSEKVAIDFVSARRN